MSERDDRLVGEPLNRERILGVVLAGGGSTRFGADKALARLGNRALIEHAVARLHSQVECMALSGDDKGLSGVPLIQDGVSGEGPIAGIHAALCWARQHSMTAIVSVPCDAPFFPMNMVARLRAWAGVTSAYARVGERNHYAFGLWQISALDQLTAAFKAGARSLHAAHLAAGSIGVDFAELGSGPMGDPFFNINGVEQLAVAETWLKDHVGA